MNKRKVAIVLFLLIMVVACSHQTHKKVIDNPTPEEVLEKNENEDIFFLDDIVYKNAERIDWVNEEELTLGKEVGEIKKQTNNSAEIENFTATKLDVGTKIYHTEEKSNIYIVKTNDKEMRYLGLLEG